LVIDEAGETLGVITLEDALRIAQERGYNLVEVAPNSDPPVCKIMDYGRFKFAQAKKEKETRRRQKQASLKEVKLRPKIGEHDFDFKKRHAIEFLENGHKVKLTIMFRGREMAHTENGYAILNRLIEELDEYARPDASPKLEGRNLHVTMLPRPPKKQKTDEEGDESLHVDEAAETSEKGDEAEA
jgi:translation initiation factor IF-3